MNATRNLLSVVCAMICCAATTALAEVSVGSLLKEMVDFDAVARWPQPEFSCSQASSYDRGSKSPNLPGWFANADQNQFIRDEQIHGRTERVMMDADGPGCIVRFWLTTDRNKQGTIRIYLDGAEEPAFVFPAFDLLSGNLNVGAPLADAHPGYKPDTGGGNNFYLPIPYAKHCKVTWEEKSQGARYYQINYRTYAPGTEVRTFTSAQLESLRPAIAEVNKLLLAPPDMPTGRKIKKQGVATAKGSLKLKLPAGSRAVRRLEVTVPADASERALRSLVLQMVSDGKTNIWCPVTDFFGSGVGLNPVESWYRTVSTNGTMICRWVMPYQRDAKLELINLGTAAVPASMEAIVDSWKWDDRGMSFHAVWHYESGLKVPPPRDWNFVTISGRGVYVGDTLALFNPVPAWYGEGDEKIWVDGESFPSHFGTGTEDYYGYSYAPKPVHQGPFCGEPRIDQPQTQGHNTSIRSRNLDGIPFHKSLQFDMELMPWRRGALTYAATTFWYAFPGAASNRQPQADAATSPIPTLADAIAANTPKHRPGAVECETMKLVSSSGNFSIESQNMDPFGAEDWSGGSQLLGKATRAGDFAEFEIPAGDSAAHKLVLFYTQARDYGIYSVSINGQKIDREIDGYAPEVRLAAPVVLGKFQPKDGKYLVRIEMTGANPAASGARFYFGLDCVVVEKP